MIMERKWSQFLHMYAFICSSKIPFTMMATNLIICNNTEGIAAPSLLTTRIEVPKY
jgi:hypothetical protein